MAADKTFPWITLREHRGLISLVAGLNNIDAQLLAALLLHESSSYIFSSRFEPGFYSNYIENKPRERLSGFWPHWTKTQSGELKERLDRSTSWGLGQIMGQTAREAGFDGKYLCELCQPDINIHLTGKILASKFQLASAKGYAGQELRRAALLKYNGGGDQNYPDRVLKELENSRRVFQ